MQHQHVHGRAAALVMIGRRPLHRYHLQAPFGQDFLIGRVDRRQLVGGQLDEFLRHAARHQAVGMVLAHQAAIGLA